MSDDLVKRLRTCADMDDVDDAADLIEAQAAEIARLRVEQGEARGYLSRLLQSLYPSIEILPDMLVRHALLQRRVCTQIDNVLAGRREEITRLRAALATARREGMEEAAKRLEELHRNHKYNPQTGEGREHDVGYYRAISEGVAHILCAASASPGEYLTEAEQERDEFFNRLGRITEALGLPMDATAQRIIEAIQERVDNEREACASVEVRLVVPEGAETWTPLEAWEEALLAFDKAFRDAIRAAAKEEKP